MLPSSSEQRELKLSGDTTNTYQHCLNGKENLCHLEFTSAGFRGLKFFCLQIWRGNLKRTQNVLSVFAVVHRAWVEAEIWTLWCTSTCSPSKWPRPRNIWITSRNCPPSANGASKVSTQDLDNGIFASASPWQVTGLCLWPVVLWVLCQDEMMINHPER